MSHREKTFNISLASVNVRGSFLITKHSLKLMKARNYGRILLIASIAGKEVNNKLHAVVKVLYSSATCAG